MGKWFPLLPHYKSQMPNFKTKKNYKAYKEARKHGSCEQIN